MNAAGEIDADTLNRWHVVGCVEELPARGAVRTRLLGSAIEVERHGAAVIVRRAGGTMLPVTLAFGYVWSSVGEPAPLFDIPEWAEPDRRNLNGCSFYVRTSPPRAIENFLDMAHFPFVHTGILGETAHPAVKDYDVAIAADGSEVVAERCMFYQPQAAAASTDGADVAYRYRVPHPWCAVLYKDSPGKPGRRDVIALFVQPLSEEEVVANLALSILDDETPRAALRRFQQQIFVQDKPILENQMPRRLPLMARADAPVRADKSSIAYRRWLRQLGTAYGVML